MSIGSVDKKSFKKLAKTISNYWFKFNCKYNVFILKCDQYWMGFKL